jgi:peptide/nickel transport system substrate-binding protein
MKTKALVLLTTAILISTMFPLVAFGQKSGGTIVAAITGDPKFFNQDWSRAGGSPAQMVDSNIYSVLIGSDYGLGTMTGQPVPDLATSWEVAADGLSYTFHLRTNALWHDGVPVTSADVKYTYDTIIQNKYPGNVAFAGTVDRIETPDNYTLVIRMKQVNAALLMMIAQSAQWYLDILPKHLYEGTDWSNNTYNLHPVGSGPFKFSSWKSGEYVELVKNENFYIAGQPYADKLIFQVMPNRDLAFMALEAGEVNYLYGGDYAWPYATLDVIENDTRVKYMQWRESYGKCIIFPWGKAPWNDSRVRQAVSMAFDREYGSTVAFNGFYTPTQVTSIEAQATWRNLNATVPSYDPAAAGALLDAAGFLKGSDDVRMRVRLISSPMGSDIIQADYVVESLRKIGIECTYDMLDWSAWYDALAKQNYDFSVYWEMMMPDPDAYRTVFGTNGTRNYMHYSNTTLDALCEDGLKTVVYAERKAIYDKVQMILAQDLPYIPIFSEYSNGFGSPEWHGFTGETAMFGKAPHWNDFRNVWWEGAGAAAAAGPLLSNEAIYAIVAVVAVVAIVGVAYYVKKKPRK